MPPRSVGSDMQPPRATYGIHRTTKLDYETAVIRVTAALKEEGFGILTEIDVKATLKKKLNVDVARYVILGACNPPLAHKALDADPDIGLLLPCNVVVRETTAGVEINAMRPTTVFEQLVKNPAVAPIAEDAEARITRALDAVADAP